MRIFHYGVACFADSLFGCSFFPTFQVSTFFVSSVLDSSRQHMSGDVNVERHSLGMLELGVFPWLGGFVCVLALLLVWYYGIELNPLSSVLWLLSACSMARGQEETCTSQARRRRGPGRDKPSASSIISSLSMEELRSYCHIPGNIDFGLSDGPAESTIDKEDDAVYFTREQLAVGLRFPVSSLIKKFLHFFGVPPALVH